MNLITVDPVERLLERLDEVRKVGRGWIAKCPAHADGSPSLSIAAGDDGRVLAHCFAGCSIENILASLGLSACDLFERRITHATSSAERAELRERARRADWRAALATLGFEAKIIQIAASDIRAGMPLDDVDLRRLGLAVERIEDALARLFPRFRRVIP